MKGDPKLKKTESILFLSVRTTLARLNHRALKADLEGPGGLAMRCPPGASITSDYGLGE